MPIKEARCTNCGSILMADTNEDTVKCLFCRAVMDTSDAFSVAANPEGYEFPNEPQPEEDVAANAASIYNKALKQAHTSKKAQGIARTSQPKTATAQAQSAAPRAQVEKIEMPSAKLSTSAKIKIAAFIGVLCLLIAAAILPITLVRDARRADLAGRIESILPFEHIGKDAWAIAKTANSKFSVVADEPVDAETALAVFREFCNVRAETYGLDPASDSFRSVYGKVTVQVFGSNGGFVVSDLKAADDLQNPGKVRPLD